jgi:hypothetical protein
LQALLDFCIANREEEDQANRFLCVMTHLQAVSTEEEGQPTALVDIFEHNEFRNLLHLRLDYTRATPEQSSQWLAKKLLMQRKANVEQQRENYELSEQHEADRQKIQ